MIGCKENVTGLRCGLIITKCKGEGYGVCTRCESRGIWNRNWMCFLYKIKGREGTYCSNCIRDLTRLEQDNLKNE